MNCEDYSVYLYLQIMPEPKDSSSVGFSGYLYKTGRKAKTGENLLRCELNIISCRF